MMASNNDSREKHDFSHHYVTSTPSLLILSAKACAIHSDRLLGQLHDTVLPYQIQKLLVETFQKSYGNHHERRQRFYDALKDANGRSKWTFPGCPLVFAESSPDLLHLDYLDSLFDGEALAEHSSRVQRLSINCHKSTTQIPSTLQLTALTLYDACNPTFDSSAILVRLELLGCTLQAMTFVSCFPNLEWLSLINVKCKGGANFNLSQLCLLRKLRHLDLTGSNLGSLTGGINLGSLTGSNLGSLTHDLSGLLRELRQLEHLDFSGIRVSSMTFDTMQEVRSTNPLKFLSLYRTLYDRFYFVPPLPAETIVSLLNRKQKEAAFQSCHSLFVSEDLDLYSRDTWEYQLDYILQMMRIWTDAFQLTFKRTILARLCCLVFNGRNYGKKIPDRMKHMLVDTLLDYVFVGREPDPDDSDITMVFLILHNLAPYVFRAPQVGQYACLRLHIAWTGALTIIDHRNYLRNEFEIYSACRTVFRDSGIVVLQLVSSHLHTILHRASDPSVRNRNSNIVASMDIARTICDVFGTVNRSGLKECNDLMRRIEATLPSSN